MARINELAKKKKVEGLTPAEIEEQSLLRAEYLTVFKAGARQTLENVTVIDPEGNDVTPDKIKAIRDKHINVNVKCNFST